jgi:hypothetical protein
VATAEKRVSAATTYSRRMVVLRYVDQRMPRSPDR